MDDLERYSDHIVHIPSPLLQIQKLYPHLSAGERRVADWVLDHPEIVVDSVIGETAKATKTSESTVVRFCKKLGFDGYPQFRLKLAKELREPSTAAYQSISLSDPIPGLIEKSFSLAMQALHDTAKLLDPAAVEASVNAIVAAEKIIFAGIGGSGAAGEMARHKLLRFGIFAHVCSEETAMPYVAGTLSDKDAVIVISYRGETRVLQEFLQAAKARGAAIIGITEDPHGPIGKLATVTLHCTSPKTTLGPEAGAARIVQTCVIDVLCLAVASRLNRKFGLVDEW